MYHEGRWYTREREMSKASSGRTLNFERACSACSKVLTYRQANQTGKRLLESGPTGGGGGGRRRTKALASLHIATSEGGRLLRRASVLTPACDGAPDARKQKR